MDQQHTRQGQHANEGQREPRMREGQDQHERRNGQGRGQHQMRDSEGEQQMREGQERAPARAQNMAEIAIRGTALLWDLQVDATRNLLRAQARTASMFGVPDYSALFRIADMRARRVFAQTAEQVIGTAREATRTVTGVQRELGRLAEQQTIEMTEEVRQNVSNSALTHNAGSKKFRA